MIEKTNDEIWYIKTKKNEFVIVDTVEAASSMIKQHEIETRERYVVQNCFKGFGSTDIFATGHKVYWDNECIEFSGIPFIIVNKRILACHYGKDKMNKQRNKHKLTKNTKKIGCPALVKMKEVCFLPDFLVKASSDLTKYRKSVLSTSIRKALSSNDRSITIVRKILVTLPQPSHHKEHTGKIDVVINGEVVRNETSMIYLDTSIEITDSNSVDNNDCDKTLIPTDEKELLPQHPDASTLPYRSYTRDYAKSKLQRLTEIAIMLEDQPDVFTEFCKSLDIVEKNFKQFVPVCENRFYPIKPFDKSKQTKQTQTHPIKEPSEKEISSGKKSRKERKSSLGRKKRRKSVSKEEIMSNKACKLILGCENKDTSGDLQEEIVCDDVDLTVFSFQVNKIGSQEE